MISWPSGAKTGNKELDDALRWKSEVEPKLAEGYKEIYQMVMSGKWQKLDEDDIFWVSLLLNYAITNLAIGIAQKKMAEGN